MIDESEKIMDTYKIKPVIFYEAIEEWTISNPGAKNDLAKINLMDIAKIYNHKLINRTKKIMNEKRSVINYYQKLKEEIDINEYISKDLDIIPEVDGGNYKYPKCPFCHKEGCFYVIPRRKAWCCTQCVSNSYPRLKDIFEYVKKKREFSNLEAFKYIAEIHGYTLAERKAFV